MACEIYAIEFGQIDLFIDMQQDRLKKKEFCSRRKLRREWRKKKKEAWKWISALPRISFGMQTTIITVVICDFSPPQACHWAITVQPVEEKRAKSPVATHGWGPVAAGTSTARHALPLRLLATPSCNWDYRARISEWMQITDDSAYKRHPTGKREDDEKDGRWEKEMFIEIDGGILIERERVTEREREDW